MKSIAWTALTAVLAAGVLLGPAHGELAGEPAPDFVLKGVDGKNYRLSEYRGRVVLLSFWASWCGECRSLLEGLADLHDRYEGSGLEMMSVSLDRERDDARDAASSLGVRFPSVHDEGGIVGEAYEVDKMPYVLLIDRDGVVREAFIGYRKGREDAFLERARALLGE